MPSPRMDSPFAQQLVGAVLNRRWRVARIVGEGGMGAVYEAHGTQGEGVRAIKVLHAEFVSDDNIVSRFFAEAQAVRMLQHPNVAQIYEATRAEDGTPYLVMEFLQGAPLSTVMRPQKPMPPQQAATIITGVLQALAVAHQRNIVHRDLKPDNLFLVPDGRGNQTVKVLDFGIAKLMDGAGGMGSKTKTGVLLGTPGYMSPEQIKNSKGVDPRSDLWSVGVILYELLSGREAFPADNEFARLTQVLTAEPKPIGDHVPQLANWNGFFQRALSKDLNQRFQSAGEMAQAVSSMVGGLRGSEATVAFTSPLAGPNSYNPPTAQPHALPGGFPMAPSAGAPHPQGGPSTMGSAAQRYSQPPAITPHQGQQQQRASVPPSMGFAAGPGSSNAAPHVNANPPTHVSAHRPGSTLAQGQRGPNVEVVAAPPVGVPWWVVGAVGGACFIVGFIVGYFVR
ncbi:MAG: protein kinase [Polyangiaceae bacterium]